jgi:hypothetical protein
VSAHQTKILQSNIFLICSMDACTERKIKGKKWRQTLKTKLYCFLFDAPSSVLGILEVKEVKATQANTKTNILHFYI